jgi:hypothetical protein
MSKQLKYRNIITEVDGIKFRSRAEANYYGKLKLYVKAGEVESFKMQVPYELTVNGILICKYLADFVVKYTDGTVKVIDVKGVCTELFKIKAKLMLATQDINILEIK